MGNDFQRRWALFPPLPNMTDRGRALWACMYTRAMLAWIEPGAYAWLRLHDQLKVQQRQLVKLRAQRA
jgi:hypothetical protein